MRARAASARARGARETIHQPSPLLFGLLLLLHFCVIIIFCTLN
jgi:hypothetical protein